MMKRRRGKRAFLRGACGFVLCSAFCLAAPVDASDIAFSTFLAGSRDDVGSAIARTPGGGVVVVGYTGSPDFPTHKALQSVTLDENPKRIEDAFVVKLDATGDVEFATYLGGSNSDLGTSVALDRDGNIYVAGLTASVDFPIVDGVDDFDSACGFVAKISPDGQTIVFSTRLPICPVAIAYDRDGRLFVTGWTFEDDFEVPIVSVDTVTAEISVAAVLDGSGDELPTQLAWDPRRGSLWVAGSTSSADFPSVRPLRETSRPNRDVRGFLARFDGKEGSLQLKSSSILLGDGVDTLAIDKRGRAHLTFQSRELVRVTGWEDLAGRCASSYYMRVQASGRQLQNVQCLPFEPRLMAVDRTGRLFFVAQGGAELRVADPVQAEPAANQVPWRDLYIAVFEKGAKRLLFGSYLGGRGVELVDPVGGAQLTVSPSGRQILLTGLTSSPDFPLVSPFQAELPNTRPRYGAFVTKLRPFR